MICAQLILVTAIIVIKPINMYRDCKIKHDRVLNYFKVKSCHKSTLPVAFWKSGVTLAECKNVARERNGLAFNFNPPEAQNYTPLFIPTCQVIGCPEVRNGSTLVMDLAYDYYSAYGNFNSSYNYTCIKSMGLFSLTDKLQNYSESIFSCQNMGGDLADITSELRTVLLSELIKDRIPEWFKAAYVGLDDTVAKGMFRTSFGSLLTCSKAWAPGHPRSKYKSENCVTMDSDKLWRVVNCNKVKLRGLCELYPESWYQEENVPKNISCSQHKGKKTCLRRKEIFEIYQNSSRADRFHLDQPMKSEISAESQGVRRVYAITDEELLWQGQVAYPLIFQILCDMSLP